MATLRQKEEAQKYQQMLQPASLSNTELRQGPGISEKYLGLVHKSNHDSTDGDNEMTFADVNREVALVINVLVSIIACAIAIWVVSRWWDTPIRLALSLSGSILVAVAEVVVYNGYLRRVTEAKGEEQKKKERREVLDSWISRTNNQQDEEDTAVGVQNWLKNRKNIHAKL